VSSVQAREPTSGLEPLTPAHYECAVRRCRGVHGFANAAYLSRFLFSALLRVAPYCVPGGIRVVSKGRGYRAFLALENRGFAGSRIRTSGNTPSGRWVNRLLSSHLAAELNCCQTFCSFSLNTTSPSSPNIWLLCTGRPPSRSSIPHHLGRLPPGERGAVPHPPLLSRS
jgi:hypothetical protein